MSPLAIIAGLAIVSWGVIVILTGLDVLHFETGALATAGAVLVGLVSKAFNAMKKKDRGKGFALIRTLAFIAALAALTLASACGTTYTGASARVRLRAYGTHGTTAILTFEGAEVCKVTGTQSTLRVDVGTAQRICEAYALECTWGGGR